MIFQLRPSRPAQAKASPELSTTHDEATGAQDARPQERQISGTRS